MGTSLSLPPETCPDMKCSPDGSVPIATVTKSILISASRAGDVAQAIGSLPCFRPQCCIEPGCGVILALGTAGRRIGVILKSIESLRWTLAI